MQSFWQIFCIITCCKPFKESEPDSNKKTKNEKQKLLLEMEEMILEKSKFDNDNYGGGK